MLPNLMPGVKYSKELQDLVDSLVVRASNARTGGCDEHSLTRYQTFVNDAAGQLMPQMTTNEIERLVLTPTYWRSHSLTTSVAAEHAIVDRELQHAITRLEKCRDAIGEVVRSWPPAEHVIVPDTNVLLHGTNGVVVSAPWHELADLAPEQDLLVVLLQTVIGELDKHKRSQNKVLRKLARTALRDIDGVFTSLAEGQPIRLQHETLLSTHSAIGTNAFLVAAVDPVAHSRLDDTDSEIIDRALAIEARTTGKVTFLTGDTGAALKARAAGLAVTKLPTPDPDAD
jgi:rRNA-processing protein FCF1